MRRDSQKKAGDRDRKQQQKRQQVAGKLLHRHGAVITPASPEGEENADHHHDGRDIEDVKGKICRNRAEMETSHRNAEHECVVDLLVVTRSLEAHPSDSGKVTAAASKQPHARNQCAIQRTFERRSMKRCKTKLLAKIFAM